MICSRRGRCGHERRLPSNLPAGIWQDLLRHAYVLIDEIARHGISDPVWTLGGGTVLMLRHQHRLSKDIDIFVPDPQYRGYVSPRLSDVAESVTQDYVEGPGYIKLLRPEGEWPRQTSRASRSSFGSC